MIESYTFEKLKLIARLQQNEPNKLAICLGDQKPTGYCDGHATARDLFKALGYENFYDIDYNGGAEVNHDLNTEFSCRGHSVQAWRADIIYDGGVLEHVANIGQAFLTILNLCKVGGWVIMVNPVNNYGESYYALDPQLHRDFFEANGFRTDTLKVFSRGGLRGSLIRAAQAVIPEKIKARLIERFKSGTAVKGFCLRDDPSELRWHPVGRDFNRYPLTAHTFYVGQRMSITPLTWPSQRKYPKA